MHVPPDFQEFLRLLTVAGVRYLLIGGYAVNAHGHHRRTDDMDVWVSPEAETAARLADVFAQFGFAESAIDLNALAHPGAILRVGRPPLRLEILNQIAGVEFDACFKRRQKVNIAGIPVNVIALRDLLKNKRAAGRPKDLADVADLEAASRAKPTRKATRPRNRKAGKRRS